MGSLAPPRDKLAATSTSVLERVAAGDQAAVNDVVSQYQGLVWSLARRLSPTPADAEDAVQEIFLDLWRSAARYDATVGPERVFIAMIARRRLIDRLRRHKLRPVMTSTVELDTIAHADPGTFAEIMADGARATRALGLVNKGQQQVITLGVLHGLSHGEIARCTGRPIGTIKTQMRRGITRLRDVLNAHAAAGTSGRLSETDEEAMRSRS